MIYTSMRGNDSLLSDEEKEELLKMADSELDSDLERLNNEMLNIKQTVIKNSGTNE